MQFITGAKKMARKRSSGKQTKPAPTQFDCAEEVQEIAQEIIPRYHSGLVSCNIGYLFKNKEISKNGKLVIGTAEKCGAKTKAVSVYQAENAEPFDFILTFAYPTWKNLSLKQKHAVVDHELAHCFVDTDDTTGDTKTKILSHDIEEFTAIVQRHGFWQADLEIFGQIAASTREAEEAEEDIDEDDD